MRHLNTKFDILPTYSFWYTAFIHMNTVTIVEGINSYTLTVLEHIKAFISLASECKSSSFIVTSDNGIWIFTVTLPFVNIWTAAFLKNKRRKSNLNNIRKNYHDIIEWASKQKVPYPEILHLKPPSESYEKNEKFLYSIRWIPISNAK